MSDPEAVDEWLTPDFEVMDVSDSEIFLNFGPDGSPDPDDTRS